MVPNIIVFVDLFLKLLDHKCIKNVSIVIEKKCSIAELIKYNDDKHILRLSILKF